MKILDVTGLKIAQLSQKHEVIAGNLINAHTPGYKQREISFASIMNREESLVKTNERHMDTGTSGEDGKLIQEKEVGVQGSLDGNTVDVDAQRSELAKNALNLETQIRFANHFLRLEKIAAS